MPHESNVISLCDDSGSPVIESNAANELNSAFSTVFPNEQAGSFPCIPCSHYPVMERISFDPNGIAKIIDSLNNSSLSGIDGIFAKVL